MKTFRKSRIVFFICTVLAIPSTGYGVLKAKQSWQPYSQMKHGHMVASGPVSRSDQYLGYAAKENADEVLLFVPPPNVPMRYDARGFRIPPTRPRDSTDHDQPLILAVGGSFTHGDCVFVEETYPFVLADKLGGTALNAGFSGYGLAQMFIKAKKLIPELRPDYVVVQYSPWLVDRSLSYFGPMAPLSCPQPYFTETDRGTIALANPVFRARRLSVFDARFIGTESSSLEFAEYCTRITLPSFISNDFNIVKFRIGNVLGRYPKPAQDRLAVLRSVYGEIARLCDEAGSTMIVCVLGHPLFKMNVEETETLESMDGFVFVDAWTSLQNTIPHKNMRELMRRFGIYRGDPPKMVSNHPNARMHGIFADAILSSLTETDGLR